MEVLLQQETSVAILILVTMKVSGAIQRILVSDGNLAMFLCVQVRMPFYSAEIVNIGPTGVKIVGRLKKREWKTWHQIAGVGNEK